MSTAQEILMDVREKYSEWMEQYESLGLNPEIIVSTALSQEVSNLRDRLLIEQSKCKVQNIWS